MSQRRLGTKVNPKKCSNHGAKIIQRCETKVVADACNASYAYTYIYIYFFLNQTKNINMPKNTNSAKTKISIKKIKNEVQL